MVIDLQLTHIIQPVAAAEISQGSTNEASRLQLQAEASTQIVQVSNIVDGNATIMYKNRGIYEGNWDNKREGVEKITWKNNNKYQDDWKNNLQYVRKLMIYWDSSQYNEEWRIYCFKVVISRDLNSSCLARLANLCIIEWGCNRSIMGSRSTDMQVSIEYIE